MNDKIFDCVVSVFQGMDRSGVLKMPQDLSEKTVLMGAGAVLDSVALVTFFVDLEQELEELSGKEVLLSLEDIQEKNLMENLNIGGLVSIIEEKYFGGATGSL